MNSHASNGLIAKHKRIDGLVQRRIEYVRSVFLIGRARPLVEGA